MIGLGVGRSGSPTPRLITSRPAAMAAFFFRSISANRYGGSFWSRSAFTNGVGIGLIRPEGQESVRRRRSGSGRGRVRVRPSRLRGCCRWHRRSARPRSRRGCRGASACACRCRRRGPRGRRQVAGLGRLDGDLPVLERLADRLEGPGVAGDFVVVPLALQVVGARLEGDFHQAVLGDVLGLDEEEALVLEEVADAAGGAEVAAADLEGLAEFAGRAVAVVGQDLAEDGDAAGAVALVQDLLVILGVELAGALLDRALDVVLRAAVRAAPCRWRSGASGSCRGRRRRSWRRRRSCGRAC